MLPPLPLTFQVGELFPLPEGQQIEFKENNTIKMEATLCGFLNTAGGYFITGVSNDGMIRGISRQTVDSVLLKVDNILRNNKILNTKTGNAAGVQEITTTVVRVCTEKELFLVIVRVETLDETHVFQTESGVWYRLNASNTRCRSEFEDVSRARDRLTTEKAEMLRDITTLTVDLRRTVIAYEKARAELSATLDELHARILADKEDMERRLGESRRWGLFCL
jgi:predicted HTH transcriptional regulator